MTKDDLRRGIARAMQQIPEARVVQRLLLFGSRLRGEESPESDVDLLVEFAEPVGYFCFVGLQQDLEDALGMPVDLATPSALSKYIRDAVLSSAEVVYER